MYNSDNDNVYLTYYQLNRDTMLAKSKGYYQKNKEKIKQKPKNHPNEKKRVSKKIWESTYIRRR